MLNMNHKYVTSARPQTLYPHPQIIEHKNRKPCILTLKSLNTKPKTLGPKLNPSVLFTVWKVLRVGIPDLKPQNPHPSTPLVWP